MTPELIELLELLKAKSPIKIEEVIELISKNNPNVNEDMNVWVTDNLHFLKQKGCVDYLFPQLRNLDIDPFHSSYKIKLMPNGSVELQHYYKEIKEKRWLNIRSWLGTITGIASLVLALLNYLGVF